MWVVIYHPVLHPFGRVPDGSQLTFRVTLRFKIINLPGYGGGNVQHGLLCVSDRT